ncbi:MAG: radical SAM protein [Chloroflexi bacterium]|nr:radical SAM protein [Chloroflexota bacterium]
MANDQTNEQRVLLVSPSTGVWNSRRHIHMGLAYLAGSLLAAGHPADLFDAVVEEETLADRLARDPHQVVGISSPTPLIYEAWACAQTAKAAGAVTILGGPHLTLMPEESMGRPEVDLVVRGEAEETILEIMASLALDPGRRGEGGERRFNPTVWSQVQGLSFRDLEGRVVHNPLRPLPRDLDRLPWPAYHLFKIDRYTNLQPVTDGLDPHARAYTIITSRGCPYQCIYCSKPITGHTWRPRAPERVVEEWRYLVEEMHATEIGVTDDVWNLDLDRAKALCRLLIAEGLHTVPWVTIHGMRVTSTDQELFHLMKAAGCKRVGFGVESGNQQVLDTIKKRQTIPEVRRAFTQARAAGLQTMGFFIFGLPTETEETMEETIRLALELDPDLGNFMMATPYPGTELYEQVKREGRLFTDDWSGFGIHEDKALYELPGLPPALVERKWHEAYRRFYLRPRRIFQRLLRPDTWRRLPQYASDFVRFAIGRSKG